MEINFKTGSHFRDTVTKLTVELLKDSTSVEEFWDTWQGDDNFNYEGRLTNSPGVDLNIYQDEDEEDTNMFQFALYPLEKEDGDPYCSACLNIMLATGTVFISDQDIEEHKNS